MVTLLIRFNWVTKIEKIDNGDIENEDKHCHEKTELGKMCHSKLIICNFK